MVPWRDCVGLRVECSRGEVSTGSLNTREAFGHCICPPCLAAGARPTERREIIESDVSIAGPVRCAICGEKRKQPDGLDADVGLSFCTGSELSVHFFGAFAGFPAGFLSDLLSVVCVDFGP